MIDAAGSVLRGTAWLAFRSAISSEHVHQRIVRFVAVIFVEWNRRPLYGQLAFPRLGESRRIVDLELIEERVGANKLKRSTRWRFRSQPKLPPLSLKLVMSTTSVLPTQCPIESPIERLMVGDRSGRPSM